MKQMPICHTDKAEGFDVSAIVSVKQLASMQAWVLTDRNGVQWLQSYKTIVSKCVDGVVQHFGKWSVSTSRQQGRFAAMCR